MVSTGSVRKRRVGDKTRGPGAWLSTKIVGLTRNLRVNCVEFVEDPLGVMTQFA